MKCALLLILIAIRCFSQFTEKSYILEYINKQIQKYKEKQNVKEIRIYIFKKSEQNQTIIRIHSQEFSVSEQDSINLINTLLRLLRSNPQTPVIIEANSSLDFKSIIYVLDICKKAGAENINFSGKPTNNKD